MPWTAFLPHFRDVVLFLDEYFWDFGEEAFVWSCTPETGVPRHLHGPQAALAGSLARERWMVGSNRLGKSFIQALEYAWAANGTHPNPDREMVPPPNTVWAGCPDWQNHGKPITKGMIAWALGREAGNWKWREADRTFEVSAPGAPAPSKIVIKSYDSGAEKWQGAAPCLIGYDECPPEAIYKEGSVRIGGVYKLQVIGAMTPLYAAAWFQTEIHEPWIDGGRTEDKFFVGGEMRENPNLPVEEIERLERELIKNPEEYRIRIKGDWAAIGDRVYPKMQGEDMHGPVHVVPDFEIPGVHRDPKDENEDQWTCYRAIDPGMRNPTAVLWVAVAPSGLCVVYREIYESDLSIPEVCDRIKMLEYPREQIRYTVIDPASAQRDMADGSRRVDTFAINGIVCILGNNDIQVGISKMRDGFANERDEDGQWRREPKYRFFSPCTNIWREHRKLSWTPHRRHSPRDPKDAPAKKNDHTCDALRYLEATGTGPIFTKPRPQELDEHDGDYAVNLFTGY